MFTNEHISFLREQLARAEQAAAGWRALITYAQSNVSNPLAVSTGQHPYPADSRVFPPGEDPRAAWTPEHERSFQGFEAAHAELAAQEQNGGGQG